MSVSLGLFATGLLALMVGSSPFIQEPQMRENPYPVSNSGAWVNLRPNNIVPNNDANYTFTQSIFSITYFNISDTDISYLGSINFSTYNSGSYANLYVTLNDSNKSGFVSIYGDEPYLLGDLYSTYLLENLNIYVDYSVSHIGSFSLEPSNFNGDGFIDDADTNNLTLYNDFVSTCSSYNMAFFTFNGIDDYGLSLVYLKTCTTTDFYYIYDIDFISTSTYSQRYFNISYGSQYFLDAMEQYQDFYTFNDTRTRTIVGQYSFENSDEIPFNDDFLDDDSSAIYNRMTLSFKEYYIENNGTWVEGNWFSGADDKAMFYMSRYTLKTAEYQSGYNDGYDNGNADGYRVGYANGYAKGVDDTAQTNNLFFNLFGSIADTPILMLRSLFNFDLFGVNVLTAVLSLLTAIIVVFVIRKFI